MKPDTKTLELLTRLKESRDTDEYSEEFPQELSAPSKTGRIPSLDSGAAFEMSPQLAARFSYCSRWTNASVGLDWLSLSQMSKLPKTKLAKENIVARAKHWKGSVLSKYPWSQLSLFAVNLDLADEIYLIWRGSVEPRIVWYSSQHEHAFVNLNSYIKYLLK